MTSKSPSLVDHWAVFSLCVFTLTAFQVLCNSMLHKRKGEKKEGKKHSLILSPTSSWEVNCAHRPCFKEAKLCKGNCRLSISFDSGRVFFFFLCCFHSKEREEVCPPPHTDMLTVPRTSVCETWRLERQNRSWEEEESKWGRRGGDKKEVSQDKETRGAGKFNGQTDVRWSNLQVDVDTSRLGVETEARINNVAEGKQDADCALHKRAGWSWTNSFILHFAPQAECTQDFPS